MKIKVFITSRDDLYSASGIYESGKITVQKGSKVRVSEVSAFKKTKIVDKLHKDTNYVIKGEVQKNIEFSSPSTAAQFITNASTNGYTAWKTETGINLKRIIQMNSKKAKDQI